MRWGHRFVRQNLAQAGSTASPAIMGMGARQTVRDHSGDHAVTATKHGKGVTQLRSRPSDCVVCSPS